MPHKKYTHKWGGRRNGYVHPKKYKDRSPASKVLIGKAKFITVNGVNNLVKF